MSIGSKDRLAGRLRACLAAIGLSALGMIAISAPASAAGKGGLKFGAEEVLRELQSVRIQSRDGEPMYLGYKVSFHWFGLPYSVTNDGYVLGVKGKNAFVSLDADRISKWQAEGFLPSPMPPHELGLVDYILGHLLWLTLALVGAWQLFRSAKVRDWLRKLRLPKAMPELTLPSAKPMIDRLARPKPPAAASSPVEPAAAVRVTAPKPVEPAALIAPATLQSAQIRRLPVARTVCRVKALKVA